MQGKELLQENLCGKHRSEKTVCSINAFQLSGTDVIPMNKI